MFWLILLVDSQLCHYFGGITLWLYILLIRLVVLSICTLKHFCVLTTTRQAPIGGHTSLATSSNLVCGFSLVFFFSGMSLWWIRTLIDALIGDCDVNGYIISISSHSSLYNRSSLSHRFANTDEALRNVSAIFAFKSDSWNSIFGSKANFMEHLALLGYDIPRLLIDPFRLPSCVRTTL